jgi:hypothetical protein
MCFFFTPKLGVSVMAKQKQQQEELVREEPRVEEQ